MTHTEHTYLVCRALDTDPRSRSRGALLARDVKAALEGLRSAALSRGGTKAILCEAGEATAAETPAQALAGLEIAMARVQTSPVLEDDSALLRVLEGRQAIPHVSAPPAAAPTLWGRPATVVNLEDLLRPAPGAPGALSVAVWGLAEAPIIVEVAETATVRQVVQDARERVPGAAGAQSGSAFVVDAADAPVVRLGGATGRFLAGDGLDTPLGPATSWSPPVIEIVPAGACGVRVVRDALRDLSAASCGACVVCREGTRQLADMLAEIAESRSGAEVPGLMRELGAALEAGSVCGLGAAVADVMRTGLEVFALDISAHLSGVPCPEGGSDA